MNVPQNNYISVFGRTTGLNGNTFDTSVFSGNGLAILKPSKCDIIENLNGAYSVTLTHPIDKDDIWKNIYVLNFLKVQGQLFRIQSVDASFDGSSSGSLTAYAEHIMYLQNDAWILKQNWDFSQNTVSGHSMYELLLSIWEQSVPNGLGGDMKETIENFFPRFYFTSNVEIPSNVYDPNLGTYLAPIGDGKTRYEMIMDAIARFGGELYRDNFYYSINTRMENAVDNAFDIRVGGNLLGIKRTIDTSKFCTHFRGFYDLDGYQSQKYYAYSSTAGFLNSCVRAKKYNYDDDQSEEHVVPEALLERDISEYFDRNMNPKFTYTIKMKDFLRNPEARLSGSRFKVGDTGKITDERLGIEKTLKIIQTKTNGITGETEEITLDSSYDFDWGYGHTILPKFPELPEKSDKIIATALNSSTKYYFDDLYTTRQFLDENPNVNYSVKIGENAGVTTISNNFANATNLKQIEIPETVYGIENSAFNGCSGLEIVHIDGANINFGINSFANCTSLKSINLHENLKNIPEHMFFNCTSLTQISLPEGLEFIRNGAFRGSGLESITIPDSVTSIGTDNPTQQDSGAFMECQSLRNVEIGNGITKIPERCFLGCTVLKNVLFHDEVVTAIGESAFSGCSDLTSITLPSSIEYLGNRAFSGCGNLASFSCPSDLVSIGSYAFSGCSTLSKFNFSDSVKYISSHAFSNCTSLKKITIPINVVSVSSGNTPVFDGCTKLGKITVKNVRKTVSGDPWGAPNFISTAQYDDLWERGLPIPTGKTIVNWDGAGDEDELADKILIKELNADGTAKRYNTVKSAGYLKDFLQENPDKLYAVDIGALCRGKEGTPTYATITAESFSGITNLKELYIPDTFQAIEPDAFSGCTNLDYVQIGGQKGRISGEPWGADSSTEFYYSANLVNLDEDFLIADDNIYTYLAVKTQQTNATYETGLSGILKVSDVPALPAEKMFYVIPETNAFSLKLGNKELKI